MKVIRKGSFVSAVLAGAIAFASLAPFSANASEGIIVDIDAKRNGYVNPVRLFLPAGTYTRRAIGPEDGGKFVARNAWNGRVSGCKYGNHLCDYGWQHGALISSADVSISPVHPHNRLPLDVWTCDTALAASQAIKAPGQAFFAFDSPQAALAHFKSVPETFGDCTFTTDRDGFISIYDGDGLTADNKGGSSFVIAPVNQVIDITIDIKPGSDRNPLNINGEGKIPVAILGDANFDVSLVDSTSIALAGMEHSLNGQDLPMCAPEYSNDDEYLDLVCHFHDQPENWEPGDGEARLTGALTDGTLFQGTDVFEIVGKNTAEKSNKGKSSK